MDGYDEFGNWVLTPIPEKPGPSIVAIGPSAGAGRFVTLQAVVRHSGGFNNLSLLSILVADAISSKARLGPCYRPESG